MSVFIHTEVLERLALRAVGLLLPKDGRDSGGHSVSVLYSGNALKSHPEDKSHPGSAAFLTCPVPGRDSQSVSLSCRGPKHRTGPCVLRAVPP